MISSWKNKIPVVSTEPVVVLPSAYESLRQQILDDRCAVGIPRRYRTIELLDCGLALLSWICGILALVAIFSVTVAAYLGETRQLIVVGFLLSITALCMQGRSTKFLIAVEILLAESSLQNLEAILQMDCSTSGASVRLRVIILMLYALPLALSVGYKSFTGGSTTTTIPSRSMEFGMTPPPGTNNTGYGLSLFSTTLLPFWSAPSFQTAYGYSLWSESATTVAILDSPLEQNLRDFQDSLRSDESAIIEATVSAVQTDMVMEWNNSTKEALNQTQLLDYFGYGPGNASLFATNGDLIKDYFSNCTAKTYYLYSGCRSVGLAYGPVDGNGTNTRNNTFFATSRSEVPSNESARTFLESAQGFSVTLRRYRGTWNVTRDVTSLVDARLLPDGPLEDSSYSFSEVYNTVFQDTYYRFETYITMLVEFDWMYPWARFDLITCDKSGPDEHKSIITTDAAFVAAMVWSRVATKWGPTSGQYGNLSAEGLTKGNTKYSANIDVKIRTQTLKQCWPLAAVILIMPTLTTLVVMVQWLPLLRGSPVSSGFGLISLLAAVDTRSLDILRGAGYSGKLSRKVHAIFSATSDDMASLSSQGRSHDHPSVSVSLAPQASDQRHRRSGARLGSESTYG